MLRRKKRKEGTWEEECDGHQRPLFLYMETFMSVDSGVPENMTVKRWTGCGCEWLHQNTMFRHTHTTFHLHSRAHRQSCMNIYQDT